MKPHTLTKAEVKHLRMLLAWLRCEYMLDEDMQRGALQAVHDMSAADMMSEGQAQQELNRLAAKIEHVPKYVRQAHKMLSKMVGEIDGTKGDVLDVGTRDVGEIE